MDKKAIEEKLNDLEARVRWLEVMAGDTMKKARNTNPYDLEAVHRTLRRRG